MQLDKTALQAVEMLQQVYADNAMFQKQHEEVKNDIKSRKLSAIWAEAIVE